jgi:hypothetical protein
MLTRWRLILGEFAEGAVPLDAESKDMDQALAFLYGREYAGRGMRDDDGTGRGGKEASSLAIPAWISRIRKLFPQKTVELMQKQAVEKYHLTEILSDPEILKTMEPNFDLLKSILTFRDLMSGSVKTMAYKIVEDIMGELRKKLESRVRRAFTGKKLPHSTLGAKIFRNFDFKRTVRANLKNYSAEHKTIAAGKIYFNRNIRRYNPWHIIILVDESGSMLNSVIYSSVMAAIFSRMPFLSVRLAIFDTALVDLSGHIDDPVGILMKVQLGGGTDIYGAFEWAKHVITEPQKTIVVLVSDLYDGNDYRRMYRSAADIIEGGSRLFILPALDYEAAGAYDREAAKHLSALGASVAALTPDALAEWVGSVLS